MEFLPTAYWVMALVGTIVTLILLFVGGDHDFAHGFGGHDIGVGHADLHGGGHDAGHQDEGPGPISLRTMLAFIGGWGWGGLIGWDVFRWGLFSAPFGLAVGLLMAMIIFRFTRFLYCQEATSTITAAHLIGQEGVVITAIPAGGTGEIRVHAQGVPLKSLARAEGEEAIADGQRITIVEELGGTMIVRPS